MLHSFGQTRGRLSSISCVPVELLYIYCLKAYLADIRYGQVGRIKIDGDGYTFLYLKDHMVLSYTYPNRQDLLKTG